MAGKSEGSGAGSSLRSKTIEKAAGRLYIQSGSTPPVPRTAVFAFVRAYDPGLSATRNKRLLSSPRWGIYTQLDVLDAHQRTGCLKLEARAKASMITIV